jgi:hypothetical protein
VSEIFSALALNKKCSVSRVTASAELKTRYKFSVTHYILWTPGRNGTVWRPHVAHLTSATLVDAYLKLHPVTFLRLLGMSNEYRIDLRSLTVAFWMDYFVFSFNLPFVSEFNHIM